MMVKDAGAPKKTNLRYTCILGRGQIGIYVSIHYLYISDTYDLYLKYKLMHEIS